jgi:hypothetical protein
MNYFNNIMALMVLCISGLTTLQAQEAIPVSGGNATGTGGSVSFSAGQIVYTTNTGITGTVAQGVQQPFEISIITALRKTEGIILESYVYPNPSRDNLKLVIRTKNFENFSFLLYDMNGISIQDKRINSEETEIIMESLSSSVYFLKIMSGKKEIKIFKIIKN